MVKCKRMKSHTKKKKSFQRIKQTNKNDFKKDLKHNKGKKTKKRKKYEKISKI